MKLPGVLSEMTSFYVHFHMALHNSHPGFVGVDAKPVTVQGDLW